MEREPRAMEPLKDRQGKQEVKESDPLSSLKVTNEVDIPPVEAAQRSGCGMCG